MNQPKVTDLDDSNVLLATPRVVSCTEGARVQPEGPQQAAHDARTRLLHRLEPDTLPRWREAESLVDRTRGILMIDDTTLDTPDAQEDDRLFDGPNDGQTKNDHVRALLHVAHERGFRPT
ncbi:MAG: hypothetical protein WCP31_09065 [Chloroflexales bacterium]